MLVYEHKRGDSFGFSGQLLDDDVPVPLTGWSARCELRDPAGALVAELTFAVVDEPTGLFELVGPDTTEDWLVQRLAGDIEWTTPAGKVASTETFAVQVLEDKTL